MSIRSTLTISLVFSSALALAACGVQTRKPDAATAHDAVDKLTYVKDSRTGECYGVTMSAEVGKVHADSMTISWVPCSPGVLNQANAGQ
jgi:hypothetical protein